MAPIKLVIQVLALCCFILATTNFVNGEVRVRVISLGLALWTAALLVVI